MSDLPYPERHAREVCNAGRWVYVPGVTLGSVKAARMLNMSRVTLLKYADAMGLTVIRDASMRRYFLVSELLRVRQEMESVGRRDVEKSVRGKRHELLEKRR